MWAGRGRAVGCGLSADLLRRNATGAPKQLGAPGRKHSVEMLYCTITTIGISMSLRTGSLVEILSVAFCSPLGPPGLRLTMT